MGNAAIEIQGVSKQFRLYKEKYTTLKERVLHAGRIPYEEFWALRDIVADVQAGETMGVLGRNGSGKSTLLKCMAGILNPTSGQIVVRGKLAAMLELGAGMQPELSGRDNIFLNGSLLGLKRSDIEKRFDDIVAFAELEHFIDNQVKYYSSGMYVRLGFAVAVNVEPDVLLIDEVLAVGDERFQQKCMDRVKQFQKDGRTIIFVSHSADVMRQICARVMVLEQGEILTVAPPGEAIRRFRESLLDAGDSLGPDAGPVAAEVVAEAAAAMGGLHLQHRRVRITSADVLMPGDLSRNHLYPGEPLELRINLDVSEPLRGVVAVVSIFNSVGGLIFGADTEEAGKSHPRVDGAPAPGVYDLEPGLRTLTLRFASIPLLDGAYTINVQVQDAGGGVVHDVNEQVAHFEVVNPGKSTGLITLSLDSTLDSGGQEPAQTAAGGLGA